MLKPIDFTAFFKKMPVYEISEDSFLKYPVILGLLYSSQLGKYLEGNYRQ